MRLVTSSLSTCSQPSIICPRFLELSSRLLLTTSSEPSIASWKVQLAVQELCPCLSTSRLILLSTARALAPYRRYEAVTLSIVEQAAKITGQVSRLVETVAQSSQIIDNIEQLNKTLRDIQTFVQFETQWTVNLLFGEDLYIQYSVLKSRLTTVLGAFEVVSMKGRPEDKFSPDFGQQGSGSLIKNDILPQAIQTSQQSNNYPDHPPQNSFSVFSGAHHFVSNGTINNILGNYVVMTEAGDEYSPSQGRAVKGIVQGLP
ncbi:hypothetical protein GALMADRAFT_1039253 [Galerina marginata CBS 339.88]|uniref:Uncharacterized protein n=1 Tax=Galerina marginata (strain CBS 339.88) TaxID=685588 RepID=A0A067SBS9_GALM3|nr:hypothetical protein GALMADRAFT_1039253 [Galerina marginata CBS 339.88]